MDREKDEAGCHKTHNNILANSVKVTNYRYRPSLNNCYRFFISSEKKMLFKQPNPFSLYILLTNYASFLDR